MMNMINLILVIFGAAFFLAGIYALFKILTTARERALKLVDGDILAFISLIAFVLITIGGAAYWIFSSIDFEAARNFKRYVHTFPETYFVEGALCLLLTYGFSKIKPNEQVKLSEGKKILVIAAGTFFGLLAIFLGLKKIFGN